MWFCFCVPGNGAEGNLWKQIMNELTYFESAEGTVITQVRALLELHNHGITDPDEFFEECGEHLEYNAQDVLAWLGY